MTEREETILMVKIVDRTMDLCGDDKLDIIYERMDCMMDLMAAHAEIPLELELLLTADDGTFGHDMLGIRRHINRATGKLEDCFVPRCASHRPDQIRLVALGAHPN